MKYTIAQPLQKAVSTKKILAGAVLAVAMTLFSVGMSGGIASANNGMDNGNGYGGGNTYINVEGDLIVVIIHNMNNYFL